MSSSFWGKKFGGAGVSPQNPVSPLQPLHPSQQVVPAHLLPQGMGGRQQQAVQHYVEQIPQAPYDGWQPNTTNPKMMDEVLPIMHWAGNPRGGAGETQTLGPCPNCGSVNYFSRREGSIMHISGQSMPPAPHCFECGYPRQQGDLGPTAVQGAAQTARQAAAPMPSGSVAALGSSGP